MLLVRNRNKLTCARSVCVCIHVCMHVRSVCVYMHTMCVSVHVCGFMDAVVAIVHVLMMSLRFQELVS